LELILICGLWVVLLGVLFELVVLLLLFKDFVLVLVELLFKAFDVLLKGAYPHLVFMCAVAPVIETLLEHFLFGLDLHPLLLDIYNLLVQKIDTFISELNFLLFLLEFLLDLGNDLFKPHDLILKVLNVLIPDVYFLLQIVFLEGTSTICKYTSITIYDRTVICSTWPVVG
jgi:hypothetical protein